MRWLARVIAHVDMDAFFASVELLARPELVGLPVIVARESGRSVVLSASYEARAFGVSSAMPLARARQLCPGAVVVEPAADYGSYSARVMEILLGVTDAVEQVSIDEAFVDLTSSMRRLGDPVRVMEGVRQRIAGELGLPSSVGLAPSKFVAKMASSLSKPAGLWVVPPARVQEFLDPLPVSRLWGVGPKTSSVLEGLGVQRVEQLRQLSEALLVGRFGAAGGAHLYRIARGIDERPVSPERVEKSLGAEHTFERDASSRAEVDSWVYLLALKLARRLRERGLMAGSLSLKVRYSTFETLTRACSLEQPLDSGQLLHARVMERLEELGLFQGQELVRPVRLLGLRAERLDSGAQGFQGSLFDDLDAGPQAQRWGEVERAMDRIQDRFGVRGLAPAKVAEVLAVQGRGTEKGGGEVLNPAGNSAKK